MPHTIFTSESVTCGHPDKVADQISDAILDAFLAEDSNARVACETMVTTNRVILCGEYRCKGTINIEEIVRKTIRNIGYTEPGMGFDADSCEIQMYLHEQSPDIAMGVDEGEGLHQEMGAGDQGMMFGFACDETPEMMPLPISLANTITQELQNLRESRSLPYLKPDGKAQVSVEYDGIQPIRIHTIVISTQHSEDVTQETIQKDLKAMCQKIVPSNLLDAETIFHINPTGRFVIGGPIGDCGLTGRKIIVDTYGGMGRHGGGAFSGKDPSKVDRSAAYVARYVAKHIISAKLATRCEVQIAYAIGVSKPVSVRVETFGTSQLPEALIAAAVMKIFDLTPAGIIHHLQLQKPIYSSTASGGHFGRLNQNFSWEQTDQVEALCKVCAELCQEEDTRRKDGLSNTSSGTVANIH